ncbi:ABC transporter permease [Neolewinella lacunae]|uniref:ABC transporter permease n=1 Tax=Neolewinella lacunae TaxID=1517758 RepID=A0A923PT09_9BACT|nr:FtsX-like permease family protein [Neolewinella lacunae]MBC6996262.1 ABC transporter permease [Neolewinella lacunae]MDN3636885.1 ABC transporter permease [Neolewinella lacunae]
MIKNYLLLALKVLKRKPLYTFISLFGISFTLMILMLLTSLFDATLGANQPLTNRDRLVLVPSLERTRTETDTITKVDTVFMDNGQVRYDTTETYEDDVVSTSNGPMSYQFVTKNLTNFKAAENYAFYNDNAFIDGYLNGQKFSFAAYYVNANYWEIFDFDFLYGGPLNADDDAQASKVVVLTDKAAKAYFGEASASVIGREMDLGTAVYRVRGIVARPLTDSPLFGGDIYMPITNVDPRELNSDELSGGFSAVLLASSPGQREALQEEINFLAENYDMSGEEYFDALELFNAPFITGYAQGLLGERDAKKAVRMLFIPIGILILLFVALPLLNLVNLNISRVYERKSEIGVRKAFGANSRDILYQFIFENLILTFIGGAIGMAFAVGMIAYINANDLLGITRLSYSYQVFLYFLLVIIIFGFLSGILPAYRMSKTNVAESLR